MEFFDSHAHYDDERYDLDRDEILSKMKEEGITRILTIGSNIENSKKAVEIAEKYEFIYATVGIHPSDISNIDKDMAELENLSKARKVVAIGEIGLDYYWDKDNKELQKRAFKMQIELANKLNLPIIIHSRDAYIDTIEVLEETMPIKKGVFHCCQLNAELVKKALDMGFNISFAGPITFKNTKNAKEILSLIPLERLHIETDAPYLSPEPFRGQRNDSIKVKYIAQKMAELKGVTLEEIAKITYENTLKLFNIKY